MQKQDISKALTGEELSDLLDGKVKIITYKEIAQYKTLDQLLRPYGRVIVLYESRPQVGHWVLIHRLDQKNVEVFDSYGFFPDEELDYIDDSFRKNSNQLRAHLTKLLSECRYNVHYNDHGFQELKKGVNTCGRWAVFRALNSKLKIDDFFDAVADECKRTGLGPDELVCEYVRVN